MAQAQAQADDEIPLPNPESIMKLQKHVSEQYIKKEIKEDKKVYY